MKDEILLDFEKIGVDIDGAISRLCGNVELYKKLLLKFLEDKSYEQLVNSIIINDYKNIESYAHTLKGLSGNLGFIDLSKSCINILENVRNKEFHLLNENKEKLSEQYKELITLIMKI